MHIVNNKTRTEIDGEIQTNKARQGEESKRGLKRKVVLRWGGHIVRASNTGEKIKITQAEPSGREGQVL